MVFQNYALYPNMTVEENMSFGLKMSTDMSDEEIEETVTSSAEMMDIGERWTTSQANSPVDNNSASHSARAIVRDPNVFLMDEPLSNLDAKLRAGDADRDQSAAERPGRDDAVRHARPDGGDDDG